MYICLLSAYSLYYPLWRGYASCIFGLCYVVKLCNSFTSPSSGTSLIVSAWQPTKQPVPSANFSLLAPILVKILVDSLILNLCDASVAYGISG